MICVSAEMFGETQLFILDTGATVTVLDSRFEERLGNPVKNGVTVTASTDQRVTFYANPQITIGNSQSVVAGGSSLALCTNLSDVRMATGRDYVGLIGMDFLASKVLRIDFDKNRAVLLSQPTAQLENIEKIHFTRLKTPAIRLQVPDEGFHSFEIDTGHYGSATLASDLFRKLARSGKVAINKREGKSIGMGGAFKTRFGTLEEIRIGPYRVRNITVNEGPQNKIGLGFLERFETELDFPNKRAYFRPGAAFHQQERKGLAHIGVKRLGTRTLVCDVRELAETAGVCDNDVITQINGVEARELSIPEIHALCSQPDTDLNLMLERDGTVLEIKLRLKREPDPFPTDPPEDEAPFDNFK